MNQLERKIKNNRTLFEKKLIHYNSFLKIDNMKNSRWENGWDNGWGDGRRFRPKVQMQVESHEENK